MAKSTYFAPPPYIRNYVGGKQMIQSSTNQYCDVLHTQEFENESSWCGCSTPVYWLGWSRQQLSRCEGTMPLQMPKESCNWIESISVAQCQMCVATHSSWLQPSIICMPHLQPWCLDALVPELIYDPGVRDGGSGQPWVNDRTSWSGILPWPRSRASGVKGISPTTRPPLSLKAVPRVRFN